MITLVILGKVHSKSHSWIFNNNIRLSLFFPKIPKSGGGIYYIKKRPFFISLFTIYILYILGRVGGSTPKK